MSDPLPASPSTGTVPPAPAGVAGGPWAMIAALLPAAAVGVFYFGASALLVLSAAMLGCLALEQVLTRSLRDPGRAAAAGSAASGLLLGMSLPPAAPLWLVGAGCAVVSVLRVAASRAPWRVRVHPVAAAWVVLRVAFPASMTAWSRPVGFFPLGVDALTGATPLAGGNAALGDVLMGRVPGCIGETSALALGLGGLFLVLGRLIPWQVPAGFLGGAAVLSAAFRAASPEGLGGVAMRLGSGGLVLGACFIAADRRHAPATPGGQLVFGAGCGLATVLIRSLSGYPEGVALAIALLGLCVPLIDLLAGAEDAAAPPRGT